MIPARYSGPQREAVAAAYRDATAKRIVELAGAGELRHPSGGLLAAFEIPETSVRAIAQREREKLAALEAAGALVERPARDAVEILRRRLVVAVERELDRIEIEQASHSVGGEALRQVGRALRELAVIPGPIESRPAPPGAKVNGARTGGVTRGGLAFRVLSGGA